MANNLYLSEQHPMSKTVDSGGWRPGGDGGGAAILIVAMSLVVGGVVSLVDVPGVLRVFGMALLCAVVVWAYGTIALAMVNSYQYGKAYAEVQAGKKRDEQVTLTCRGCTRTLRLGRDQCAMELAREMRRCPYCQSTALERTHDTPCGVTRKERTNDTPHHHHR